MAYRVQTRTNMKPFKQMEFGVMRRFSDFLGLHEKLTEKYAKRGRIIPPAPEKSLVSVPSSLKNVPGQGGTQDILVFVYFLFKRGTLDHPATAPPSNSPSL